MGNGEVTFKVSSKVDVYIVAKDFSWTYVRTHEYGLGTYLCIKVAK